MVCQRLGNKRGHDLALLQIFNIEPLEESMIKDNTRRSLLNSEPPKDKLKLKHFEGGMGCLTLTAQVVATKQ
jgi:hypothetical protein